MQTPTDQTPAAHDDSHADRPTHQTGSSSGPPFLPRLDNATIEAIAQEVRRLVAKDLEAVGWVPSQKIEMAERWDGGELILRPGKSGLQEKSVPVETFFRKIVLARERMRVLEQKINNHPKLDDGDKVEMQKYLTQVYGSFTTFNVLFADRIDWFVGQKSDA